jgi:Na+(H+)/acetate symporter ActP
MLFVIYVAALLPSDPSTIYTTDLTWGILSVFGLIAAGFITTLKFSMFCKKQCIKCLVKGILSGIIFIFQLIWLFIDICNSMWDFLPESIVHLKEIMTAFNYLGVVICTTLLLFSIKSFCFHKICKDTKESSK